MRSIILPSLYLVVSLMMAVVSSWLRQNGKSLASGFLALVALGLALAVSFTLVPRLWSRVRRDYFPGLRYLRITKRGALFVLTLMAIAFASFNTGNNLLILVLSTMLSAILVSAIVSSGILRKLRMSLSLPSDIHAGRKVILFLAIQNLKRRMPAFALSLKGRFQQPGEQRQATTIDEKSFPFIRPQDSSRLRIECVFEKRGVFSPEDFNVTTTFPFGFFVRGRPLDVEGQVVIYPFVLDAEILRRRFPDLLSGPREAQRKGSGNSLYNIRPYQTGDRARQVHWKSTAKTGELMVKDFAQERGRPLRIFFSTQLHERTPESLGLFEDGVSLAASLAHFHFSRGRRFSFSSGEFSAEVDRTKRSYESLMQYLAQVQPSSQAHLKGDAISGPGVLLTAGTSSPSEGISTIDYLRLDDSLRSQTWRRTA